VAATTAADAINFIATVLCGKDLAGIVEVSAFDQATPDSSEQKILR
jgi:hypothetical protein